MAGPVDRALTPARRPASLFQKYSGECEGLAPHDVNPKRNSTANRNGRNRAPVNQPHNASTYIGNDTPNAHPNKSPRPIPTAMADPVRRPTQRPIIPNVA